jgi:hypothetical protein
MAAFEQRDASSFRRPRISPIYQLLSKKKLSELWLAQVNIAMLLTDGFGGFGGMAKFNRDFMQALDAPSAERVYALPQPIPHPIEEPIPESMVYDRKAAGGACFARLSSAR